MPVLDPTKDRLVREAARDASLKKKRQKQLARVQKREANRLQVEAARRTAIERQLASLSNAGARSAARHNEQVARLDID